MSIKRPHRRVEINFTLEEFALLSQLTERFVVNEKATFIRWLVRTHGERELSALKAKPRTIDAVKSEAKSLYEHKRASNE